MEKKVLVYMIVVTQSLSGLVLQFLKVEEGISE